MCDSTESGDLTKVIGSIGIGAQIAGGFTTAGAAASKSISDRAAYNIQAAATSTNAALERAAAADALRRGQTAVINSELKTRQLKGQQVAEFAARGISLSEGTPLNILSDTDLMGANDANVLALNAAKEAWGYDVRAGNDEANARLLRSRADMESPKRAAITSLLTSAGSVASKWYATRNPTTTSAVGD